MRAHAEVLEGLTGVLGAAEEQGVGTGGLLEGELVQGDGLAAGSGDAGAGGGGEAHGGDLHLGDLEQAVVVGDGADNDNGLLLVAVLEVAGNARQGDGGAVDAGHKEAAQDNLVEGRVGTAWREWPRQYRLNWTIAPCREAACGVLGEETYEPGSGRASPRASGRRCCSWAPCGACP